MKLNDREIAAVLAGLRMLQAAPNAARENVADVFTNGGTLEALSEAEIDALCERLNIRPAEKPIGKLAGLLAEALPIVSAVAHPETGDDPAEFGMDAFKLERRIRRALARARKAASK